MHGNLLKAHKIYTAVSIILKLITWKSLSPLGFLSIHTNFKEILLLDETSHYQNFNLVHFDLSYKHTNIYFCLFEMVSFCGKKEFGETCGDSLDGWSHQSIILAVC